MEIAHRVSRAEYESQLAGQGFYKPEGEFIHFATWNQLPLVKGEIPADAMYLVLDDGDENIRYEEATGLHWPHYYGPLYPEKVREIREEPRHDSVHVLMNTSQFGEKWIRPWLKKLIRPRERVCVLAMSYFDDTKNKADWDRQYAPGQGIWYRSNTDVFFPYGLKAEQIVWVDPFTDSPAVMKDKILRSSILLLPGGAPDLFMKRIRKYKLQRFLKNYTGLVIGYSAGAMIQLDDYHIAPDPDYPDYSDQKGFGALSGFDIEVHYQKRRPQLEAIEHVKEMSGKPIYAIYEDGALVVGRDGAGRVTSIAPEGKVDVF